MIHGVFGKLGSGKGLYVMKIICDELMTGNRDVVTNVPLRLLPWVNGQGQAQIGFSSYLESKGYENFDWGRVHVIEDMDMGFDLFMWRRDGETGDWFKMESSNPDSKGQNSRFDPGEAMKRHCQPVLIVTDEAWAFYPNNGGWSRSPLLPFYGRQSRKLRDEWFIVTQHPGDVDSVVWNIAQDFTVCRNHGMERMGIFRQPSMFRTITYLTNPVKGGAVRSHEAYCRLDSKGLAQCYDTTAGVGFSGGFKGDAGGKRKGIHIGWLLAFVVAFVVFLCMVPHFMGSAARMFFVKPGVPPRTLPGLSVPARSSSGGGLDLGVSSDLSAGGRPAAPETNVLTCTGFCILGKSPVVFFSDGSTCRRGIERIEDDLVVITGRVWDVVGHVPPSAPSDSLPALPETLPVVSSRVSHVNEVNILPAIHGPSLEHSPRLNGLSQMQNNVR